MCYELKFGILFYMAFFLRKLIVACIFDSVIDGVQRHQIKCGVKTFVTSVINIFKYGDVLRGRKLKYSVNEVKECCFPIAVYEVCLWMASWPRFWVRILLCMLRVVGY